MQSNSASIHQRHLRFLMIKIYKSISQVNPESMCYFTYFTHKELPYNLRKGSILNLRRTNAPYYGTNAVHFKGTLIWNNLPAVVKSSQSLCKFNRKIENHRNIGCECLIYKYSIVL